jgi:hypothetical protein
MEDLVLHDRPAARRADLAAVGEGAGQRVVHGRLEVGIGEDDVGTLAAELHRDLLHVDGRATDETTSGIDAAGERDEVHVRAVGQGLAHACARSDDEIDDALGRAGLREQAGEVDRRQWRR